MSLFNGYTNDQLQLDASLSCKVNPLELEWEPAAVYYGNMTFDESLRRLREAGYTRHPRPHEAFSLLCDHFEGNLDAHLDTVAQDLLKEGEWLSMAVECKGNSLVCYTDPENLRWDRHKGRYIVDGTLEYSDEQVFDISVIPRGILVSLKLFCPEFAQAIYSREFSSLPEDMKADRLSAQVTLPEETGVWPVARGLCRMYRCIDKASRGVRRVRE